MFVPLLPPFLAVKGYISNTIAWHPPPSSSLQVTQVYHDACSALELDPSHSEAAQLKKQQQEKALTCKNQVTNTTMILELGMNRVSIRDLHRPQAVQRSLVGKKVEALKKITTAIETDPAVAEFHVLRYEQLYFIKMSLIGVGSDILHLQ